MKKDKAAKATEQKPLLMPQRVADVPNPPAPQNPPRSLIGGTFAPPLDKDGLDRYKELAETIMGPVGEYMRVLINMLREFWKTGRSKAPGRPHPSGRGTIVPLEQEEVMRMDPYVPYDHELRMMGEVFDKIDPVGQKEIRDAAFHLLWFGRELFLDREPLTNDMLGG